MADLNSIEIRIGVVREQLQSIADSLGRKALLGTAEEGDAAFDSLEADRLKRLAELEELVRQARLIVGLN